MKIGIPFLEVKQGKVLSYQSAAKDVISSITEASVTKIVVSKHLIRS